MTMQEYYFKLFSNHNGCFLESFNAKSGLCSVFSVQCSVLGVQCSLFRWRLFQYLRTLNCGALTPSVVSWWTKGRYVPSDDVSVFWFVSTTGAQRDKAVLGISSNPFMPWIPLSHIVVEAEWAVKARVRSSLPTRPTVTPRRIGCSKNVS